MDIANVAVINLARRHDRLAEFMHHARPHLARLDAPVTAFAAVERPRDPDHGCLLSHLRVMATLDGPVLVFEDDACFAADFTLDLIPPADWEILWLGGQHRLPPLPMNNEWVIPTYFVRTHAYIVRDPAMVHRLMQDAPRMDPHIAALRIKQYVLRVHTVGQRAGTSDIDGSVRHQDEYWHLEYGPRFNGGKPYNTDGQY